MVTGLAFFVSVFFAPIFSSIPGWATGGALVFVGSSMMRKCVLGTVEIVTFRSPFVCSVREINWDYVGDAVPAFLTIIVIPLTYKCVTELPLIMIDPDENSPSCQHRLRRYCWHYLLHDYQRNSIVTQKDLWWSDHSDEQLRDRGEMGYPAW